MLAAASLAAGSLAAAAALVVAARPSSVDHVRPQWRSGLESHGLAQWSWHDGGNTVRVVRGGRSAPRPRSGRRMLRFVTDARASTVTPEHTKLYQSFGTNLGQADTAPPASVSGTYRAWFFFPRHFRVPHGSWVNVFQFKEKYRSAGGGVSDPLWWIQLGDARWTRRMGGPRLRRPDAPVAFLNHWNNQWQHRPRLVAVPLGHWMKLRADVVQGRYIDFWLASRYLGRARASEYPVSPFHGVASMEWIFGIGEYSTGANGPLYADDAAFYPSG